MIKKVFLIIFLFFYILGHIGLIFQSTISSMYFKKFENYKIINSEFSIYFKFPLFLLVIFLFLLLLNIWFPNNSLIQKLLLLLFFITIFLLIFIFFKIWNFENIKKNTLNSQESLENIEYHFGCNVSDNSCNLFINDIFNFLFNNSKFYLLLFSCFWIISSIIIFLVKKLE